MNHKQRALLDYHLEDFRKVCNGDVFSHFFCPILWNDTPHEPTVGHVIPQGFDQDLEKVVYQRKDVDTFFGGIFEGDYVNFERLRGKTIFQVLDDPELHRIAKPKVILDGVPHTIFKFSKYHPETTLLRIELEGIASKRVGVSVNRQAFLQPGVKSSLNSYVDNMVPCFVTFLKSAHLLMFHMCGYAYGTSATSHYLGYQILKPIFDKYSQTTLSKAEVHASLRSELQEHSAMVRLFDIDRQEHESTNENQSVCLVMGSSGNPFAIGVKLRIKKLMAHILLPFCQNSHVESAVTYLDFMKNENEEITIVEAKWNAECQQFDQLTSPQRIRWPKTEGMFDFTKQYTVKDTITMESLNSPIA